MSLRIVAYQDKPKHFVAAVEDAEFGNDAALYMGTCPPGECLTYAKKQPPSYPLDMVQEGVSGTVYIEMLVDSQGHVADLAVRQVDLRKLGDGTQLDRWRRSFARATLAAARNWMFHVPVKGKEARKSQWVVTTPVNYSLSIITGKDDPGYGEWDAYVPGPVNPMPWAKSNVRQSAGGGGDAVPETGTPFIADTHFVLLTPLGGDRAAKPSPALPGKG
jgi:hypothetical protein